MNGVAVRSLENSRGPFAIVRRTFLVINNSNILVIKCENTTSENRRWVSRKLQISSTNRTLCPWSEYTLNRKRRFIIQLKWCISLMFRRLYSMYTWLAFRLCDFWSSRIFFSINLVGRIFFPFFPISFLLHLCCMQFFSSEKRLQEIFFKITPPPLLSRVKWSAPNQSLLLPMLQRRTGNSFHT